VTDDEVGRDWVKAFLLCGFRTRQLKADARWLTDDELAVLRKEIRGLTFEDIGLVIHLTDAEHTRWKAWRFFPWDVAPCERTEWLDDKRHERRRAASRRYYWKQRCEKQQMRKGELRMEAILRMFIKNGPQTMPQLVKRARHSRVFPSVRSWPLGHTDPKLVKVHRELVRKYVAQLVALGRVVVKNVKKGCQFEATLEVASGRGRKRKRRNGLTLILDPHTVPDFAGGNSSELLHKTNTEKAQHLGPAVLHVRKGNGQMTDQHSPRHQMVVPAKGKLVEVHRCRRVVGVHHLTAVGIG
jgi:hypothetical protein